MTRAHEFGHNLGLGHAGANSLEYGDNSGVMGSARNWKLYTTANAYSIGFVSAEHVRSRTVARTRVWVGGWGEVGGWECGWVGGRAGGWRGGV